MGSVSKEIVLQMEQHQNEHLQQVVQGELPSFGVASPLWEIVGAHPFNGLVGVHPFNGLVGVQPFNGRHVHPKRRFTTLQYT